jgi:tRNA(fMet)-specific endonuclease VapC
MSKVLIDTDILSYYIRGVPQVVEHASSYYHEYGSYNFSIITYYEVLRGLFFKDSRKQIVAFYALASISNIISLTIESVTQSASLYAHMRQEGTPVMSNDLLIAGTALSHGFTLATNNVKHFSRFDNLILQNWTQP